MPLSELNRALSKHMAVIQRCTVPSPKYGHVMLATTPDTRYPYVYPRDVSAAVQLFRRIAGSKQGYDSAEHAFGLIASMANFMLDVQAADGSWGQRYSVTGTEAGIYIQEDNVAHGIAILCNYLLTAARLAREVPSRTELLGAIDRALGHAMTTLYHRELNLFRSTTSIHESALEEGYTCWVNYAFLYAFSLADEVAKLPETGGTISPGHLRFRKHFLHSVSELLLSGGRYVRRIDLRGNMDMRPDFTLLSPFYFGFLYYKSELAAGVRFIEKQLCDPELGLIMRYLPFTHDFATHVHAGNGPWLQYSAVLAQYHYWAGNASRGDALLAEIDAYRNDRGEIPEHLSTCRRFDFFMEHEWQTGVDVEKEFHKPILLEGLPFDRILEETNHMAHAYHDTGKHCMIRDDRREEGGYIQFAIPLMWSHVEYARALMAKHGDWWKMSMRRP